MVYNVCAGNDMRRLYEQLAAAEPQNRRMARHVFFACAKEGDFKSQQAVRTPRCTRVTVTTSVPLC
jgi:hypothetical protein